MFTMEVEQFLEGVIADDVAIEDEEEAFGVAFSEFFFCVFDGACSAKGFMLLGVDELDSVFGLQGREGFDDLSCLGVDGDNFASCVALMLEFLGRVDCTSALILLLVWQLIPRMISLTPILASA